MKKTLITIIITVVLMGLGINTDTAKDIGERLYCKVQPQECIKGA